MASLSDPFIKRPVMTMMCTLCIVVFGILGFLRLPVNDLPAVDFPVISVSVNYPGASPDTMARNVATPLERQFMQIPGLALVTSQSAQGNTSITLQFDLSKSVDAAATDVQAAINQATSSLPLDLPAPPVFTKFNPNDRPVINLAMTSASLTQGQLYDYASSQVAQRISILPGVAKVDIYGSKAAVRVKVDPSRLSSLGLTVEDLSKAIQAGTSYQGAGQFDGSGRTFLLQPQGQLEDAASYGSLIIGNKEGSPIYLRDVAEVTDSVQDERMSRHFWMRGGSAAETNVVLAVSRQSGANAVATAQGVKDLLPLFHRELPGSIQLVPMMDRSITIVNSVNDVKETLLIAFALVVIVIFLFLGRATDTLIPVVALPMSMLITFLAMYLLGYSIDNLSLLALTLSIGFLVDDAIVFLENAVRRMEAGETALEAAFHGAKEISFTILSMTLSLAAVFLPMVFMPGLIGRTFQEFAITIIIAIISSGIVSLTLTPLMCARMLARHESGKKTWLELHTQAILGKIIAAYGRSLHFFLRHKWISALAWVACMAGTVILFKAVPKSFLPVGDSGTIRATFMAQEGSSPERMRDYQYAVDKILRENPYVALSYTLSGLTGRLPSPQARIQAYLLPANERPSIDVVMAQLAAKIYEIPGILPRMQADPVLQISTGATSTSQGKFAYALSGINPAEVNAAAGKLMEKLRTYPGFLYVDSDLKTQTPNLQIDILREPAATYGVSAQAILTALSSAYAQNYVYLIKKSTDQYQVIMEVSDSWRTKPDNLEKLYVKANDGTTLVPLKAVARWKEVVGPQSVNHINQFPSVTVFFSLAPGAVLGDATKFIEAAAAEVLPSSIHGSLQGEALVFKETITSLSILMIFAVFAMYIILGILYESYVHPLTVLSALPVATIGGLATLFLFNKEASLYAFVGMFLLVGIVKKNGIMMIDFALQRMADGLNRVDAVHEASVERFRPIVMTTFAALMGAVPLALGMGADGSSRQPLGLIIVGGLIVSQLVTLYITPALFLYFEAFQERVLDRFSFFRSHRATHVAIGHDTPEPEKELTSV
ncbi:MAG: efflux RND transporter permease subunit [Chthoniobacteraceae bacterium]|nr:efflux RND transporter permease subunit [Chthoniobacteraceae bacterium]